MLIRGVDYPFYKSLYDMMTSRTIRIYAIMDEILNEETIKKLENKEQSEMVALLHSLMLTHQKCRILANMIDCPKEISENVIFDELMAMPKKETDAAMVFFFNVYFPRDNAGEGANDNDAFDAAREKNKAESLNYIIHTSRVRLESRVAMMSNKNFAEFQAIMSAPLGDLFTFETYCLKE